ncbi:MAG: 50S ribosomal protein L23 [Elusimicrobia bacterium]|nr:MAG: 50S ribosomal protein L23 [Elusimicrobiota bacterium]
MAEYNPYNHIVRPVMTERSTILKEKFNQYVFEVQKESSKGDIQKAVETIWKVGVEKVRTMRLPGKYRRFGRGGGYRSDWKKAIVTLKKGDAIDLLEQSA